MQGWIYRIDAFLIIIGQILTLMDGICSPLHLGSHGTVQFPFLASSCC